MLVFRTFQVVSIIVALFMFLSGCSATGANVRNVSTQADRSGADGVRVSITGADLQLSSQHSGRIYMLHSRSSEVLAMAETVATYYGFEVVDTAQADFVFEVKSAVPDGGACIEGMDSAELGMSYSLSLLTLGAFPATTFHCLVVTLELYANVAGEASLMGEFVSNAGAIEVVAGAQDLHNYRLTVKPEDERQALEVSIGSLYSEMIKEGAFQ